MSKPASGTAINGSAAISTSLVAAWGLLEGSGTSSADGTGHGHTLTLATSSYWTTVGGDPEVSIPTAVLAPIAIASPIALGTTTPWSVAFRCKPTPGGCVLGNNTTGNGGAQFSGSSLFLTVDSGVQIVWAGVPNTVTSDYVITCDGGGGVSTAASYSLYANGSLMSTQSGPVGYTSQWTLNTIGNGDNVSGTGFVGEIDYVYAWSGRVLTLTDAGTLHADGYAPYRAAAGTMTVSPSTIPTSSTTTITLTGSGTAWDGTTVFSLSGVAGVTKTSQSVTTTTAATVVVATGSTTGTLTVTESVTGTASGTTTVVVANTITVTHPVAFQTFQRDGSNFAQFTVSGTYTGTAPTTIEVDLAGNGFNALTSATIGSGAFTGTASIMVYPFTVGQPPQGTLTVRSRTATPTTLASATVATIGVGDVFIGAGQSNALGFLFAASSYSNANLKAICFEQGGTWKDGNDPTSTTMGTGSYWPMIATQHMADQGVPFAIIPAAVNGVSLVGGPWAAPSASSTAGGTAYQALLAAATASGVNAVKGVLWWQGESDVDNSVAYPLYLDGFRALASAVSANVVGNPKFLPVQLGYVGVFVDGIRKAIADAVTIGGAFAPGMPGNYDLSNATHPGNTSGDTALGAVIAGRWWAAIKAAFFAGISPGRGPRVLAITYNAARTAITVAFDQPLKTGLTFDTSIWSVTGNSIAATVSAVAYSGTDPNAVVLTLSAAAATPILVSFGQGGSTGGKVVPLSVNITLPAGGTTNLSAEPFANLQAVAATGGGTTYFSY